MRERTGPAAQEGEESADLECSARPVAGVSPPEIHRYLSDSMSFHRYFLAGNCHHPYVEARKMRITDEETPAEGAAYRVEERATTSPSRNPSGRGSPPRPARSRPAPLGPAPPRD